MTFQLFRLILGYVLVLVGSGSVIFYAMTPEATMGHLSMTVKIFLAASLMGIALLYFTKEATHRNFSVIVDAFMAKALPIARKGGFITAGLLLTMLLGYWAIHAPHPQNIISAVAGAVALLITVWIPWTWFMDYVYEKEERDKEQRVSRQ